MKNSIIKLVKDEIRWLLNCRFFWIFTIIILIISLILEILLDFVSVLAKGILKYFILCQGEGIEVKIGLVIAIGALFVGIQEYIRKDKEKRELQKQHKRAILNAIKQELSIMGSWLRTDYTKEKLNSDKNYRWHPFSMVLHPTGSNYTVRSIDPIKSYLFSDDYIFALVKFNQYVENFRRLIERDMLYSFSFPVLLLRAEEILDRKNHKAADYIDDLREKKNKKKKLNLVELFIVKKQESMFAVHIDGIGEKSCESLCKSFHELEDLTEKEINNINDNQGFNKPNYFIFVYLFQLILISFVILLFISLYICFS